jgi:hypothetical protein
MDFRLTMTVSCRSLSLSSASKSTSTKGYYAIFDLEELLIILGCQPEFCWRVDPPEVRHRYGLPDLLGA